MREITRSGYTIKTSNDTDYKIYDSRGNLLAECKSLTGCLEYIDAEAVKRGD